MFQESSYNGKMNSSTSLGKRLAEPVMDIVKRKSILQPQLATTNMAFIRNQNFSFR